MRIVTDELKKTIVISADAKNEQTTILTAEIEVASVLAAVVVNVKCKSSYASVNELTDRTQTAKKH